MFSRHVNAVVVALSWKRTVVIGTGLITPLIAGVWQPVLAVDLSRGMLRRSAATGRAWDATESGADLRGTA